MSELVPVIKEVISSGGEFNLYTRGTSMKPTIIEGVHSVMLGAPQDIVVGDIILYERKNGQFVLHRLVKIKPYEYFACGDNQFVIEGGISPDAVIAKVTKIQRGDDALAVEKGASFLSYLALRRCAKRVRHTLSRIKHSIIKK